MQDIIKPSVSVIIPSFNHDNYIGIAIQSVLDQTFSDYELLIADDGSSDNSWNVIKGFKDERIVSYKFDSNIGAAETTNFLIEKARGKYVALLNSDDYWHKNKLKIQYDFMEQNPNYAACFTNVSFIDDKGNVYKDNRFQLDKMFKNSNYNMGMWLEKLFFNLNSLCHPSIMIKREIYTLVDMYNPCFAQLPDYDLWIKILKFAPIHIIEKKLTFFRITSGNKNTSSITYENIQRQNLELELILDSYFDNMSNEIFAQGFSQYFKKKGELSQAEFECEKAFIYFMFDGKRKTIYRNVGIKKIYKLLLDRKMAEILQNSYGFTYKDFRKLKNRRESVFDKFIIRVKSIICRSSLIVRVYNKIRQGRMNGLL